MRRYGLTGGIGTGKSTVARFLRELGEAVVDADEVAREMVEPGTPGLAEIAARFPSVLTPDGRLDRRRLGERVFSQPAERAALNAILHPRIQARVEERARALDQAGFSRLIYDAPLLIENQLHLAMDGVILVVAPEAVQLARLRARDGLDEAEARARIAAQLPLEAKRRFARWIVDNGGSLEQTRAQVEAIVAALEADSPLAHGPRRP